jgi:hypothetical protein
MSLKQRLIALIKKHRDPLMQILGVSILCACLLIAGYMDMQDANRIAGI